ncbi:hydrogenase maturation nickel metallochaperone HypA/HybF [Slackia exigua]|uniref:hydrogenase maturation nickel metallochaperone HypA/HybF n=1 Tax=Slackia exigua TaxID=84109 RepID=UPI0021095442|nr:hydrogenase maturation nickel metallochaperone HypA [Slackia exigua]MCQ5092322.1 hydrogenase maturation nickel metallochaperone HypA [Slackia exigua]
MHEMSLVRGIVDVVTDECEAAHVGKVFAVHVVVGEGRDIVEDLFGSLFRFLARGTVAEDAKIVIEKVPYMVRCRTCGYAFHLNVFDKRTWSCPNCDAFQNYDLVSGKELYISKIEAARKTQPTETEADTETNAITEME